MTKPSSADRASYRLAMKRGDIPTMLALRETGRDHPTRIRPPASLPNALVLRPHLARSMWLMPIGMLLLGGLLAALLRDTDGLLFGVVLFGCLGLLLIATNTALALNSIAIDGPLLAARRNVKWEGPVDLRTVMAVGYLETNNWRSPARLRFGHVGPGSTIRRLTADGFDPAQIELLRARDARVVTVNFSRYFLTPGILVWTAAQLPAETQLSASARAVLPLS